MAFRIPLLSKARGQAPAGGKDISPLVEALTRAQEQIAGDVTTLPRPLEWMQALFGPGQPLPYAPLNEPREDTGMPAPRQYQYPVYWNVPGHERVVGWEVLKKASESPLFRSCIEIRKNEISCLDWSIGVSKTEIAARSKDQQRPRHDVENELRQSYKEDIARATDFWRIPDRRNGRDFAAWIALLLEEHLKWDAMAIYPRKTYGGDLLDLMVLDGSTIKPLLDEYGMRPEFPNPAYQQILYGYPRGEFTADFRELEGKQVMPNAYNATQLIYERRVQRPDTPYGYSPTEQALLDGLLWNKRFAWMMAEYTEGAQPVQWIVNKGTSGMSAQQLLEFERMFNDRYAGKTATRHRNPFLPEGLEPFPGVHVPERYKPDYDLFILKLVASHYDVTIAELGFTEPGGLGSAGYHEGQADIQYRKATLPTSRWIQQMLTRVMHQHMRIPSELEFTFLGLEDEDEASADAVAESRLKRASYTLNDDRARLGLPPYPFKEANMPMVETARGVVFVEGASEVAPAGIMIEPQSENISGNGLQQQQNPGKPGPASVASDTAKAVAEIVTYRRWVAKHADPTRPFRFEVVTPELAGELAPDLLGDANAELAKAGGGVPKAASSGQAGRPTSSWQPSTRLWY